MGKIQLGGDTWSIVLLVGIFVVFIALMIIPQKRREKKIKAMLAAIKAGDNIKTIGGIYGKVVSVKEDLVTIETGPEKAKIVFAKGAIATVEAADVESDNISKT